MRLLLALFLLASSGLACASEQWRMIWVTRSTHWSVKEAQGNLARSGGTLRGTLTSSEGIRFTVSVKLSGKRATGTFKVIQSDTGPAVQESC